MRFSSFDWERLTGPFRRSKAWTILAISTAVGALAGLIYAVVLALPLYSSVATVVVRGGTGELSAGGAVAMTRRATAAAAGADAIALLDGFLVQEYLSSPDAMREVDSRVQLFDMFPDGSWDPAHPLPANPSPEARLAFYRSVVKVHYSLTRQTVEIEGRAKRPDQAIRIAQATIHIAEDFINRYNARVRRDLLATSASTVREAEEGVASAQDAIRALRNSTGRLDPEAEANRIGAVIQQLEIQRAGAVAERDALRSLGAPTGNPKVIDLDSRIATLERFIENERTKLVGSAAAISGNISSFENANADLRMAQETLTEARSQMLAAQTNLTRQQRYLLTISSPTAPSQHSWPRLFLSLLAGAAAGFIAAMLWLLFTRAFAVD
jgi:capsular polysaccharide transport system permease protein